MSSNTNIGNTPVNQGYVQLIHMGETGGIDGTLRALYDGDGTASDLLIASDKVKISTELYIGSKTLTEFVQDTVGAMFSSNTETNITVTYQDGDGTIDLVSSGEVTLTGSETLTNKTLTSPVINTGISGTAFLDEDNMASNSATKFASQQSIKAYVDTEVAGIVSSAPSTLDTLNELAAALGDDANFSTTVTNSIATKLPLAGGQMTGNITFSGSQTVDGRDVSADGSKLDGIEASATADQSNAEIRTAVEAATDSNVFTDADHSKLNAIEASADVTDTANVTSAGALMDSEVDADIKTLSLPASTTISATAKTLLDDANVGAMRDTLGLGTLAQKSEIDNIDQIAAGVKLVAGESFVDSDDNLMTAAAIDDRINSAVSASTYSFTLSDGSNTQPIASGNTLTMTGSTGIDVVVGATDTATLTFDGSELPDMTDAFAGTDEFIVLDGTTSKRKAANEIRLTTFDDTGFSTITIDGTTANGVLTYGGTNNIDTESALTFDGSTLALTGDETISSSLVVGATAKIATTGGTGASQVLGTGNSDTLFTIGRFSNNTGVGQINFLKSRNGTIGSSTIVQDDDGMGAIIWGADDGTDFVSHAAKIDARIDGTPGANDTPGRLSFYTTADGSQSAVERMRIDSSGNVGIGQTSPSQKLDIQDGQLTFTQSALNQAVSGRIRFNEYSSDSNVSGAYIQYNGASNYLQMFTNTESTDYEFLRALRGSHLALQPSGGNVGIGTVSPSQKLHVAGSVRADAAYYVDGNIVINTDGNFEVHDTRAVTPSTDLGLKGVRFDFKNNSADGLSDGGTYHGVMTFQQWSDASGGHIHALGFTDNGYVHHRNASIGGTFGNWKKLIQEDESGNVGIGTTSPGYKLQVSGGDIGIDVGERLYFGGGNHTYISEDIDDRLRFFTGGAEFMRFTVSGGSNITNIQNDTYFGARALFHSGNFSVQHDTNHAYISNNVGNMYIRQHTNDADLVLMCDNGSGADAAYLTLDGSATNLLLSPPGNVGIGTTSPAEKLDVAGNIRIGGGGGLFAEHSDASKGGTVIHPNGGTYRTSTSTHTGAIKITLPTGGDPADMLSFWVDVYDYTTDESFTCYLAGYAYQTAGSNEWINEEALILSANQTRDFTVRFGHDGSNHCVYIGELASTWDYPQITVRNVQIGFNADVDTYNDGWSVGFEASAFQNVDETQTDNFPYAKGLKSSSNMGVYVNGTEEFRFETDGDFHADADVIAYSTSVGSDRKLKKNIKDTPYGLSDVMKMRAVEFDWKEKRKGVHDIGVIAQEVEKIIPEVVKEVNDLKSDETHKVVDYAKLSSVLIKAIQEQQVQIDELKTQIGE